MERNASAEDEAPASASSDVEPRIERTIESEIDSFVNHVESISDGFMVGMIVATQAMRKKAVTDIENFETTYCTVETIDGKRNVQIPGEKYQEWKKLSRRVRTITLSLVNLPRSLLVSLVSHYDAYLAGLIKAIYLQRPELLNASDRKLSFEEITKFDSVRAIRDYTIEKEVESVLRSSHVEQFRWMERTYDLPLTKDLDSWRAFVELTERRNLFVHTGGVVSSQYLVVCRRESCTLAKDLKEGDTLGVPQEYHKAANDCVFEIGVKLGHVLWRKVLPDQRSEADRHLINMTHELLLSQKYSLAAKILDFACDGIKKHHSETFKLMLTVNRALAYKWMGDEKAAKLAMRGIDWQAKGDEFKLANALISDDWQGASRLMLRIGSDGSVEKADYHNWSMFKEWRKRDEFKQVYRQVFNEDFDKAVEVNTDENHLLENDSAIKDGQEGMLDDLAELPEGG